MSLSRYDPNFPTGDHGLVVVDKNSNKLLFIDFETFEVTRTLSGFAPRIHELAISPDRRTAYCPIYGDGRHGANPNPGHLIAVFDLHVRRHKGDFSLAPHLAPHGLRWGPQGQLYANCENSGVIVQFDAATGDHLATIETGSNKAHRIEVLPDGTKLYTENEEDASCSVIDLVAGRRIKKINTPNGLAGIGLSPDGARIVLVDDVEPQLLIVDTAVDEITATVKLEGHSKGAQIARFSPDGRYCVVTAYPDPIATILNADLTQQRLVRIGRGPMNMAFHPDGRTVLIANQDEGTIAVVDLVDAEVRRTVQAGDGPETLSFY